MIAQHQPVGPGHPWRRGHLHLMADERGLDPPDPRTEAPRSMIECSISLSMTAQSEATEVNGPM